MLSRRLSILAVSPKYGDIWLCSCEERDLAWQVGRNWSGSNPTYILGFETEDDQICWLLEKAYPPCPCDPNISGHQHDYDLTDIENLL